MAVQANKTERVPDLLREAFRSAMWGKQGPVLLDIPRDLLDKETLSDEMLNPGQYRTVNPKVSGDLNAVQQAAELLLSAERPLLLAGGGVVDSEASSEAVQLSDLLDMAMVPSYGHHDAIPNSHPNYIGPPGGRGSGEAHEAMDKADVILALGTKINQASSSWDYSVINQETKIIQVDIDPIEIGRNYPVSVGIVGDAQRVAQQLIEAVSVKAADGKANDAWKSEFQSIANKRIQRLESEKALSANPMMPQQVYPELAKALPKGAMVTIDAGVAPGLAYDRVFFEEPRTMFNYAGQGALGMGFSVGLGTKLGRPDRTAVSLHGDGGFLYTCGELNTAVRHNIPSVSIVLNNSCMGAEKSQQKALHNEKYVGVDLENPRFDKLAEVFGAKGYYAEHPSEIADTVAEAVKSNAPAVIEIPVQEYFPPSAPTPR